MPLCLEAAETYLLAKVVAVPVLHHFCFESIKSIVLYVCVTGQSIKPLQNIDYCPKQGCTVVWWLAPWPHSKRVPGSTPGWGLSVWSLHVLPMHAWVPSGYSGFLSPSKNMHVRLIGVSKIVLRSVCERVCGCLSLCCPVMDWRPVQDVPRLSLDDRWDRLQPPHDPTDGLSGYRKWMDG